MRSRWWCCTRDEHAVYVTTMQKTHTHTVCVLSQLGKASSLTYASSAPPEMDVRHEGIWDNVNISALLIS